ncbi:MAG: adenylate kinase [archaeon]|nr:adenylate kinase [archaeon]
MSSSNIQKRRRIVIVGIPGVGKSTVVAKVVEMLNAKGKSSKVINYGTVMLEQAMKSHSVRSRDEIRKLSIEAQKNLQVHAASEISKMEGEFVIVDTHLFISTTEGFWPGIPMNVIQALMPTNLILVSAKVEEILGRRQKDATRSRDPATKELLEKELVAATSLLYASTVIAGCPALIVENHEGAVDEAALRIVTAISSS